LNFVCAYRRADAAAANRYATIHLPRGHGLRERDHIIRIIIALAQVMSPKIDDLMSRCAELSKQVLLKLNPP
jgi:hypothetical protein